MTTQSTTISDAPQPHDVTTTAPQTPAATIAVRDKAQAPLTRLISEDESGFANLLDTARFEHLWRVAQVFSRADIVPDQYRGKPENCFIACQMAVRLGVDPFMFMQKSYVVAGRPSIEAQLVIALANRRGPFSGPIQWRLAGEGMTRSAVAYAVHRTTGEVCECEVSVALAKAEGWWDKKGSKWPTMTDQMLRYRSAAWLVRLYAPECLMGMVTQDEAEDLEPPPRTVPSVSIPEPSALPEAAQQPPTNAETPPPPPVEAAIEPAAPPMSDGEASLPITPKQRKALFDAVLRVNLPERTFRGYLDGEWGYSGDSPSSQIKMGEYDEILAWVRGWQPS